MQRESYEQQFGRSTLRDGIGRISQSSRSPTRLSCWTLMQAKAMPSMTTIGNRVSRKTNGPKIVAAAIRKPLSSAAQQNRRHQ